MLLLFGTSTEVFQENIKTKLMLCYSLFIVHAKVKAFLKLYCSTKQSTLGTKVGVVHA